jgi:hypothetical protein
VLRALLILPLLPFVVYAGMDLAFHFRSRKPGIAEEAVHVALGLCQLVLVVNAFRGDLARLALGGLGVAVFGAADEFAFHRGLPARESDLHAKSHFALFAFTAAAVALIALPGALR